MSLKVLFELGPIVGHGFAVSAPRSIKLEKDTLSGSHFRKVFGGQFEGIGGCQSGRNGQKGSGRVDHRYKYEGDVLEVVVL